MDFGVVLQTNPPAARTVQLSQLAEAHGFSHVWTFDSHLLWQEPYVIHSAILNATKRVTVGPFVTNPATRDWTVTASVFATLNELYGNRTICGIGRGDSAVRVTNGKPVSMAELRESIHVIRELANSRAVEYKGATLQFPWSRGSELEVWVAAYGPLALKLTGEVGDGFILQLADVDIAAWMIKTVKDAAAAAGRDPESLSFCVAAPMYIGDDWQHMRDQCRWFGGMVGNHVADIVAKYGQHGAVPEALTAYIEGRKGYDYNTHGKADNDHVDFVPDEIVDRFCILGTADEHIAKLEQLRAIGVTQFAGYLQHDSKEETLRVYGETVIPALVARDGQDMRPIGWSARRQGELRGWIVAGWGALGVLAVLLIWELYKFLGPANGFVIGAVEGESGSGVMILPRTHDRAMPHVWDMVARLFAPTSGGDTPPLWISVASAALVTLGIAAVGWIIGVAVGAVLGLVMQRWRLLEWGLLPWIVVSQIIPLIAFAPVVNAIGNQIDRGGGTWPQWLSVAVIASYLAFFPVAIGVLRGLGSPDRIHLDLMHSYAAGYWPTLLRLRLPAAVPHLLPALRLAAANAVLGAVVAEVSIGMRGGIGRMLIQLAGQASSDPAAPWGPTFGSIALGLIAAASVAVIGLGLANYRRGEATA